MTHSMDSSKRSGLIATTQNGLARATKDLTVAEIKERAKDHVHKEAKSASALPLIKSARIQSQTAQTCELGGDLQGALTAYIKSATLAQMFMDSAEWKQECQQGKKGVLWKEFMDFQHVSSTG